MKRKLVLIFLSFFLVFQSVDAEMIVFSTPSSVMHKDLISFLETSNHSYKEYLSSNESFLKELMILKKEIRKSEGMSKDFRYYPIIFINGKAFSGFNKEIKKIIEENYGET